VQAIAQRQLPGLSRAANPSRTYLIGLGELYVSDPRFAANYVRGTRVRVAAGPPPTKRPIGRRLSRPIRLCSAAAVDCLRGSGARRNLCSPTKLSLLRCALCPSDEFVVLARS
jgi:hypothetical protein